MHFSAQSSNSYVFSMQICSRVSSIAIKKFWGSGYCQHLTLIQMRTDPLCPLCQEEKEAALHLLGKCSALSHKRLSILGSMYLDYEDLGKVHWYALLRLAKSSKRL